MRYRNGVGGYIMVNIRGMSKEMIAELSFTEDEKQALLKAKKQPIVFDEKCPETTPERAVRFRRVNPPRDDVKRA